jgi:hypothetical protein
MTDGRSGGTRLLVTTLLAAVAVGGVLLIDAYMQDDLHEQVASIDPLPRSTGGPDEDDGLKLDPGEACWGPFLSPHCLPPLLPPDWEQAAEAPNNEPVARRAKMPKGPPPPEEVGLTDRVFAQVIDSWHAPKACATEIGEWSGTPTVRMEMDIDESGHVKDARAYDVDSLTEEQLASCLRSRARGLRFPAKEVRHRTTRDATFVF